MDEHLSLDSAPGHILKVVTEEVMNAHVARAEVEQGVDVTSEDPSTRPSRRVRRRGVKELMESPAADPL